MSVLSAERVEFIDKLRNNLDNTSVKKGRCYAKTS